MAFALSGAIAVYSHLRSTSYPLNSAFFLVISAGLLTGVGGGVIWDLAFIGRIPVLFTTPGLFAMALLGSLFGFLVAQNRSRILEAAVDAADFVTVGLAGVLAFSLAHRLAPQANASALTCITALVAMVTSCCGGIVRDFMFRRAPFALTSCYLFMFLLAALINCAFEALLAPWLDADQPEAIWPLTVVLVMVVGMMTRHFRFRGN